MKLYKVKVLLAANHANQVWKENVTAAEIKLLEHIHVGENPSVIEIEHTATTTRTDRQERARLLAVYGEYKLGQGETLIRNLFGVEGVPLPQSYEPPVVVEAAERDDVIPLSEETITPVEPIVRAKRGRPAAVQANAEALAG